MSYENIGERILVESAKEIAKEAYSDGLKPTVTGIGAVGGHFMAFFNDVILYPMRKVRIKYFKKLEEFSEELESEISAIPIDFVQDAPLSILGPTLEALKYKVDEVELKDMFKRLLCNSMDSRKSKLVHPSYVRIIENMDVLDARLFSQISKNLSYQNAIKPTIQLDKVRNLVAASLPEILVDYSIHGYDMHDVSRSIVRLERFGLITFFIRSTAGTTDGKHLLERTDVRLALDNEKKLRNRKDLVLTSKNIAFKVNDYGSAFSRTCLR